MTDALTPPDEAAVVRAVLAGAAPADVEEPLAVVTLWHPQPVSRDESVAALDDLRSALPFKLYGPAPYDMGWPSREVMVVLAPSCDDPDGLQGALASVCKTGGLAAIVAPVPTVDAVPATYALTVETFDAQALARRALETAVLSLCDLVAHQPYSTLSYEQVFFLVHHWLGAILALADKEQRHLRTLRLLLDAGSWTLDGDNGVAEQLDLSLNAVRDRLAKINELIGIDLSPNNYTPVPRELRLALALYDLYAEVLPPPGDRRWRK